MVGQRAKAVSSTCSNRLAGERALARGRIPGSACTALEGGVFAATGLGGLAGGIIKGEQGTDQVYVPD